MSVGAAAATRAASEPLARRVTRVLTRRTNLVAGVVAAAVLVAGTAYALTIGDELRYSDERDYTRIARHLVEDGIYSRDGIEPTAYRPPGYPLFVAALRTLGLRTVGFRVAGVVLLVVALLLLHALARRVAGPLAASLAVLVAGAYPLFLHTAALLYPQTLGMMLLLAGLLCTVRARRGPPGAAAVRSGAGAGVAFGLLVVTIPNFLVGVPIAAIWLWRARPRRSLVPIVLLVVCSIVPLTIWNVRNLRAFDTVVPIATNSGLNLLYGNSPDTNPGSGTDVDISAVRAEAEARGIEDEVARDRFYREQAVEWIRANPIDAAVLYAGKVLHTFTIVEDRAAEDGQSPWISVLLGLTFVPLLALATTRLVLAGTRRLPLHEGEGMLVATYAANVLALAVFFTRIRFRVPLDSLMILLAASLLAWWLARASGDGDQPAVAAVVEPSGEKP